MAFAAKVVLDSIGPNGKRIISVEFTEPRFVHAEFMTHRDRARNAASSRAIPWSRTRKQMPHESDAEYTANMCEPGFQRLIPNCMKRMVLEDPVIPIRYGRETKGMQQGEDVLSPKDEIKAKAIILRMRDQCVAGVEELAALGLHKSICNRYVEPWMWITVLTTSTEWNNLFHLRCHPMAEVHFKTAMEMTREVIRKSVPTPIEVDGWHAPYIRAEDTEDINTYAAAMGITYWDVAKLISVGRCARLSYLTHEGKRNIRDDIRLAHDLLKPPKDPDESIMHASPFEHVAQASNDATLRSGPFIGWKQFRKEFSNENVEGCTV